jgi:hypothetical protein
MIADESIVNQWLSLVAEVRQRPICKTLTAVTGFESPRGRQTSENRPISTDTEGFGAFRPILVQIPLVGGTAAASGHPGIQAAMQPDQLALFTAFRQPADLLIQIVETGFSVSPSPFRCLRQLLGCHRSQLAAARPSTAKESQPACEGSWRWCAVPKHKLGRTSADAKAYQCDSRATPIQKKTSAQAVVIASSLCASLDLICHKPGRCCSWTGYCFADIRVGRILLPIAR